jgi:hypothetical protein
VCINIINILFYFTLTQELAAENKISYAAAIQDLFEFLEQQYDIRLLRQKYTPITHRPDINPSNNLSYPPSDINNNKVNSSPISK